MQNQVDVCSVEYKATHLGRHARTPDCDSYPYVCVWPTRS